MVPVLMNGLSRYWKRKQINIYDTVFNLHSKVTVCLLVCATLFLSANQFFGVRIDCLDDSKHKSQLDNFCWMTSTFTGRHHFNGTIGSSLASYGVSAKYLKEEDRVYQTYYQWVSVFLMIHALIFSIPAYCWKVWERRTLDRLIGSLSAEFFVDPQKEESLQALYNYILHSHYRLTHRVYALRYFLAELLNLIAVAINILLLNLFLQGFWLQFLPAIQLLWEFDYARWLEATAHLFPRMAKCEFFFYGPSGTAQSLQALCLLPLNVVNEKIYAAAYMWFLVLFIVSVLSVMWKVLLIACRPLRMLLIRLEYREVPSYQWEAALDGGSYSQWFLFRCIAKNLSPSVVHTLADRLCHTAREEYFLK